MLAEALMHAQCEAQQFCGNERLGRNEKFK